MKVVELHLQHENLFCPVTGHKILYEDDFSPSPALVFCYFEDWEALQHMEPWFAEEHKDIIKFERGEFTISIKQFWELIGSRTDKDKTLVCFSITTGHLSTGATTVHFCFDMNYVQREVN